MCASVSEEDGNRWIDIRHGGKHKWALIVQGTVLFGFVCDERYFE